MSRQETAPRSGASSIKVIRFVLVLFAISAHAQEPASPVIPPKANDKSVFQRGLEMYQSKNFPTAFRAFTEAATAGNVEAMMYVGTMSASGEGTPVNYRDAMTWFRKAADTGDAQAMCNLAILYYRGLGVPVQYFEALKWFRASASSGNAQGMFNLGVMYRDGLSVPVNLKEAVRWFTEAASAQNELAMNSLGVMYQKGRRRGCRLHRSHALVPRGRGLRQPRCHG